MSTIEIDIRHAVHPDHAESMGTDELRAHFLVTDLFRPGKIKAVYTHYDRMILLGIQPDKAPLALGPELSELVKTDDFLSRREIGIFNIGGRGHVMAGGRSYALAPFDALYLPPGTHNVLFESADHAEPALFYANSAPAHATHPAHHMKAADMSGDLLGAEASANRRILTKYMHPAAFPTCQLVMGRTELQTGNVWNTLPPHTHDRRMEAYLYHGLDEGQAVFHLMGRPDSTRHLVVRNNEAILSPPWSIHCGAGTAAYAFIWSMAGDNQTFTDMDAVPVATLF
jgi:4-deoxy-L-threo-5-hexosulose-uronate ketol-isomerase